MPEKVTPESATVIGGPPARDTIRIDVGLSVMNATREPSGEKVGFHASSLPGIGVASSRSRDRSQSRTPPEPSPTYTIREPSGDTASRLPKRGRSS